MTRPLAEALRLAVVGTPLFEPFEVHAAEFLAQHGREPVQLPEPLLFGLARLLASNAEAAGFAARRSVLARRLLSLDLGYLERRSRELEELPGPVADLEEFLDEIRLLRRDETLLAAVLDLSGAVHFDAVSSFLAVLAESIVRRAHAAARSRLDGPLPATAVVAMGKLAGREFTYHSDLDLVFLHDGGVEAIEPASRLAQRTVGYLCTMTGAGVAYAVDMRLRPSGQKGSLVTSFDGYAHYQLEQAETWEHMALLRARAIAGDLSAAQQILERVRTAVLARRRPDLWSYVADMRARVEKERGQEGPERYAFKTGPGGLMDVEFLAVAGMLERGPGADVTVPGIPHLLRTAAPGPATERLLLHYAFLRKLEARTRWVAGRPVEHLDAGFVTLGLVGELLEPGLSPESLLERLEAARREVRSVFRNILGARVAPG